MAQNIILDFVALDFVALFLVFGIDNGQQDSKVLGVPVFELERFTDYNELKKQISEKIVKTLLHFSKYKKEQYIIKQFHGFEFANNYIKKERLINFRTNK